jgi:hypothetical protein
MIVEYGLNFENIKGLKVRIISFKNILWVAEKKSSV